MGRVILSNGALTKRYVDVFFFFWNGAAVVLLMWHILITDVLVCHISATSIYKTFGRTSLKGFCFYIYFDFPTKTNPFHCHEK